MGPRISLWARLLAVALTAATAAATPAAGAPPRVGEAAPPFYLLDTNRRFFSLSQARGKVVAVYFWKDDCACAEKLPKLERFYRENRAKGFELLAVNAGQPQARIEGWARRNALSYEVLLDPTLHLVKQFGVTGIPTVFLLDRTGVVRERLLGEIENDELVALVKPLL